MKFTMILKTLVISIACLAFAPSVKAQEPTQEGAMDVRQRALELADLLRTSYPVNWLIHELQMNGVNPFEFPDRPYYFGRRGFQFRMNLLKDLGRLGVETPKISKALGEVLATSRDSQTWLQVMDTMVQIQTRDEHLIHLLRQKILLNENSYFEIKKRQLGKTNSRQVSDLDQVLDRLEAWLPGRSQEDDITTLVENALLALSRLPDPSPGTLNLLFRVITSHFELLPDVVKAQALDVILEDFTLAQEVLDLAESNENLSDFLGGYSPLSSKSVSPMGFRDRTLVANELAEDLLASAQPSWWSAFSNRSPRFSEVRARLSSNLSHQMLWQRLSLERLGQLGVNTPQVNAALRIFIKNSSISETVEAAIEALGKIGSSDPQSVALLARGFEKSYRRFNLHFQARRRNGQFSYPKSRERELSETLLYARALAGTRHHEDRALDHLLNLVTVYGSELHVHLKNELVAGVHTSDPESTLRVKKFMDQRFQWLTNGRPKSIWKDKLPRYEEPVLDELAILCRALTTTELGPAETSDLINASLFLMIHHWKRLDHVTRASLVGLMARSKSTHGEDYAFFQSRLVGSQDEIAGYAGALEYEPNSKASRPTVLAAILFEHSPYEEFRAISQSIFVEIRKDMRVFEDVLVDLLSHDNPTWALRAAEELRKFNPLEPGGLNRIARRVYPDERKRRVLDSVLQPQNSDRCQSKLELSQY